MQRTGSPHEGCGYSPPTDGLFSMKTGSYYRTLTQIHPPTADQSLKMIRILKIN